MRWRERRLSPPRLAPLRGGAVLTVGGSVATAGLIARRGSASCREWRKSPGGPHPHDGARSRRGSGVKSHRPRSGCVWYISLDVRRGTAAKHGRLRARTVGFGVSGWSCGVVRPGGVARRRSPPGGSVREARHALRPDGGAQYHLPPCTPASTRPRERAPSRTHGDAPSPHGGAETAVSAHVRGFLGGI